MNIQSPIQQSVPARLARVREIMAGEGVDALLVPRLTPIYPSICQGTGKAASGCLAFMAQ